MEKIDLLKKGSGLLRNLSQRLSSKEEATTSFQNTLEDSVSKIQEKKDESPGLLQRLFSRDPVRERQVEIERTRADLEDYNLTIADLNRKIERMEKIAVKWKERGEVFDSQA